MGCEVGYVTRTGDQVGLLYLGTLKPAASIWSVTDFKS